VHQATGAARTNTKFPSLDGLRGVAILLVIIFHFVSWSNERAPTSLRRITEVGTSGVDLFFVLSGFLITGILSDARGSKGYYLNFYMRRVLRIFPLYYAVVMATTILGPLVAPHDAKVAEVAAQQGWLWGYAVNISVAIRNRWSFYGMNHFWSLAVEEQFYLIWPFLVASLPRVRMVQLCVTLWIAAFLCRLWFHLHGQWLAVYTLTPCRMDEFAAGGLAALLLRGSGSLASLVRCAVYIAFPSGVLAVILFSPIANGFAMGEVLRPTALSLFFGSLHLLIVLRDDGLLNRVLRQRWLRTIGKYSYGLYVIHHPLRQLFELLFSPAVLANRLHSPALGACAFTGLSASISIGLAALSFHIFESPALRLKRYFEYVPVSPSVHESSLQ